MTKKNNRVRSANKQPQDKRKLSKTTLASLIILNGIIFAIVGSTIVSFDTLAGGSVTPANQITGNLISGTGGILTLIGLLMLISKIRDNYKL